MVLEIIITRGYSSFVETSKLQSHHRLQFSVAPTTQLTGHVLESVSSQLSLRANNCICPCNKEQHLSRTHGSFCMHKGLIAYGSYNKIKKTSFSAIHLVDIQACFKTLAARVNEQRHTLAHLTL